MALLLFDVCSVVRQWVGNRGRCKVPTIGNPGPGLPTGSSPARSSARVVFDR